LGFWDNETSVADVALDRVIPNVTAVEPIQKTVSNGDVLNLSVIVTDDRSGVNASAVLVNVSRINNTIGNYTLTRVGATDYWNGSVIVSTSNIGVQNLTVYAYDYASNCNSSINLTAVIFALRINEIMYRPASVQGTDAQMEWVELYNNGASEVNASNYNLTDAAGNYFIIPSGTNVSANGYIVIANDKTHFLQHYHYVDASNVIDRAGDAWLDNGGDTIILKKDTGEEMDNVTYDNSWGADGNGYTLEINASEGWQQSNSYSGTPLDTNSLIQQITPVKPPLSK
jgi:hypothetical protein